MKALGVALVACCAMVLWPSAAHANPIGAREAAETTKLATDPGWQAFDGDRDADDGMFTAQAGLDNSAHFAAMGTADVFDDDRASLGSVIDVDGLATAANTETTLALRTVRHAGDNDGDENGDSHGHSGTPKVTHAPQADPPASHPPAADPPGGGGTQTSATPEPASMLLLATGIVGVLFFRRQLFA